MPNLEQIMDTLELEANEAAYRTLDENFDFASLRAINRDTNGEIIDRTAESYLEIIQALFRRIPEDWDKFVTGNGIEIRDFIDKNTKTLARLKAIEKEPIAARGVALQNFSPVLQSLRSWQSQNFWDIFLLQMIGDDRRNLSKRSLARIAEVENKIVAIATEAQAKVAQLTDIPQKFSMVACDYANNRWHCVMCVGLLCVGKADSH